MKSLFHPIVPICVFAPAARIFKGKTWLQDHQQALPAFERQSQRIYSGSYDCHLGHHDSVADTTCTSTASGSQPHALGAHGGAARGALWCRWAKIVSKIWANGHRWSVNTGRASTVGHTEVPAFSTMTSAHDVCASVNTCGCGVRAAANPHGCTSAIAGRASTVGHTGVPTFSHVASSDKVCTSVSTPGCSVCTTASSHGCTREITSTNA